ncbi:hypothetical protein DL93DRAFT_2102562 [Clavulina sp. PMI_390]|nr:hypothetical protein DL93DRAFT_2102562 [Clavulina sp. PMI_390]
MSLNSSLSYYDLLDSPTPLHLLVNAPPVYNDPALKLAPLSLERPRQFPEDRHLGMPDFASGHHPRSLPFSYNGRGGGTDHKDRTKIPTEHSWCKVDDCEHGCAECRRCVGTSDFKPNSTCFCDWCAAWYEDFARDDEESETGRMIALPYEPWVGSDDTGGYISPHRGLKDVDSAAANATRALNSHLSTVALSPTPPLSLDSPLGQSSRSSPRASTPAPSASSISTIAGRASTSSDISHHTTITFCNPKVPASVLPPLLDCDTTPQTPPNPVKAPSGRAVRSSRRDAAAMRLFNLLPLTGNAPTTSKPLTTIANTSNKENKSNPQRRGSSASQALASTSGVAKKRGRKSTATVAGEPKTDSEPIYYRTRGTLLWDVPYPGAPIPSRTSFR